MEAAKTSSAAVVVSGIQEPRRKTAGAMVEQSRLGPQNVCLRRTGAMDSPESMHV
jgi:hypothetical protein